MSTAAIGRAVRAWRSCLRDEAWYRALSLNVCGTVARYRGRWEETRRLYGEALALATAADLWWPAALVHANLGFLAWLEDRDAEAIDRHEQAGRIAREGGDTWMAAMCLMNAGRGAQRLGDFQRAGALHAEALRSFVALDNAWGVAACVDAFATLAADRGHHVRAARLYGAEEAIRERARVALWPTIQAEHEAGIAGDGVCARRGRLGRARVTGPRADPGRGDRRCLRLQALPPSIATG